MSDYRNDVKAGNYASPMEPQTTSRVYTQHEVDAQIAAALEQACKLCEGQVQAFSETLCRTSGSTGSTDILKAHLAEAAGLAYFIRALITATQANALAEHDTKVFHDTLDELVHDGSELVVGGKEPVRIFSENALAKHDSKVNAVAAMEATTYIVTEHKREIELVNLYARMEEAKRVPALCNRIIAELDSAKVKWADHNYVWIDAAKTIVWRALLGDKYNEEEVPERLAALAAERDKLQKSTGN
jgi:hypothetical protein